MTKGVYMKKTTKNYSKKEIKLGRELLKSGYEEARKTIVSEDKIDRLLKRAEKKLNSIPNFGEKLADIPILIRLLRSYFSGEYKDIPIGSIIAIVSALLYFVNPIDFIPDFIVGVGQIDDALVLYVCWILVKHDIEEYKEWSEDRNSLEE